MQLRPVLIGDLTELFSNITNAFSTTFNTCIEKLIDSLDKKVTTRLDIHEVQAFDTNKRIDKLEKICNDFQAENAALRNLVAQQSKEIQILTRNIDDIEQYSRGSNILVHGIQLPQDNSTETDI